MKKAAKEDVAVKNENIEWVERTVRTSELKPYERNPRRISKEAYDSLVNSLREDGYHQRILATHDLRIIGGHQRIKALKQLNMHDIKVLVPTEPISDEAFRRILVRDNLPFGEFDHEILGIDFERSELLAWGMPESWLPTKLEGDASEPKDGSRKKTSLQCPECGHEWQPV